MKKIIVIVVSLFLILACTYSFFLLKIAKDKNKELVTDVNSVKGNIMLIKAHSLKNEEEKNNLEKESSSKLEELSIWQKAENKLNEAIK